MNNTNRLLVAIVLSIQFGCFSLIDHRTQAAPHLGLTRQCGKQIANLPIPVSFWSTGIRASKTNVASLQSNISEVGAKTVNIQNNLAAFDYRASNDGRTLLFITADPNNTSSTRFLNIATFNGTIRTFPIDERKYTWEMIGPEREPGHFAILAYDVNLSAILLDMSWSTSGVSTNFTMLFPFVIPIQNLNLFDAGISPDWNVVTYPDPTNPSDVIFFSTQQNRIIRQVSLNTRVEPGIIWIQDSLFLALLIPIGIDSGSIYGLDDNGKIAKLFDLTKAIGSNDISVQLISVMGSNNEIMLTVYGVPQSNTTDLPEYILYNPITNQAVDLCLAGNPEQMQWIDGGKYIAVTENSDSGEKIFIISPETGDYFAVNFDGQNVFPIAWIQS